MREKINIMVPGGFKPVHAGHIELIESYLKGDPEHDTNVYVIISNKDREGLSAQTSYDFLNKIFGKFHNFHCIISPDKSPVYTVYNMTATKLFGDGLYAMGSSTKEDDVARQLEYNKRFSKDGSYYTPGVKVLMLIPDGMPMYQTRDDDFNHTPISSTIMRQDLIRDDYNSFLSAYEVPCLNGYVDEPMIQEYYRQLKSEIKTPMNETAAAGRIDHPYDDNNLTFGEIKEMIMSLFSGKITDIEEKIDGINILASVDSNGNVIFARNKTQLLNAPMLADDIKNNSNWNEKTKMSFINGVNTITKVFNNIKNKIEYFNYDDKADGVKYRNWISIEIVDHSNMNVIPYVDNFVSFHKKIITVCTKYYPKKDYSKSVFVDPNIDTDTYKLEQAIKETNLKDDEFKAAITPKMIFKNVGNANMMAGENINELIDLMDEYELSDNNTVAEFKYKSFLKYIINNKPVKNLTRDDMKKLAARWSGIRNVNINEFRVKDDTEGTYKITIRNIREFEKNGLSALRRRIMLPLDRFFINLGNDALKLFKGGKNDGNETKIVSQIKKEITDAISNIQETGNVKALDKLEYILFRLGDTIDINASEGIVFKYHGKFYKLTGTFAVLNQIMNVSRKTDR
jgi:hypothetical protein